MVRLGLGLGLGLGYALGLGLGSTIERVEEGVIQVRHKAAALVW